MNDLRLPQLAAVESDTIFASRINIPPQCIAMTIPERNEFCFVDRVAPGSLHPFQAPH